MNNRQLKFRVWDKARNQWVQFSEHSLHAFTDYFLTFDGKIAATEGEICDHPNMEYQTNFDWCDYSERPFKITRGSDRFVIQQYTGLKDKNGKEIYEGDIIKFDDELNVVVNFGYRGAWMLSDAQNWIDIYLVDHLDKGVIGNIFENSDLLNECQ